MKYIKKGESPRSLEEYKITDGASFQDLDDNHTSIKREIKNSLIDEQGGICCYCGTRIDRMDSVIEHFKPKAKNLFPELQLEYSNLLASCFGGQIDRRTNRRFPLCCDANKENRVIEVSPTDPDCESCFKYDDEGNIYGTTPEARHAIQILNLNNEVQKNRRRAAIQVYSNLPEETDWQDEIRFLSARDRNGLYQPYCFAAIYYIKNFLMPIAT